MDGDPKLELEIDIHHAFVHKVIIRIKQAEIGQCSCKTCCHGEHSPAPAAKSEDKDTPRVNIDYNSINSANTSSGGE